MSEDKLELDAARTHAILATAGTSGTWDWNIPADRLHVDERFAGLYGLSAEDVAAGYPTGSFFRAIHPDDRPRMRIAVAGILGGAEIFSKEFRVVDPDGTILWMHGRGQAHYDADDNPVRFTGLLIDVTERKRTEERLRIAQSAGGIGTFEYVDGFATVAVSTEFCELLGFHPAPSLPVRTINNVVRSDDAPLIPQPEQGIIPVTLDGVFRIERSDNGEERWIARRGEILREGSGYRLVGVIYDVTASKEQEARLRILNDTLEARVQEEVASRRGAEEALRQAQKMEAVGQLTGGIAHDFNNLLTIIIGNVDTVLRHADGDLAPRVRRSLDNALKGAERAASLTQRLLAFSRQQPLAPKTIDVASLLNGLMDLLTRSIPETIEVRTDVASDVWRIEADPHQLENAILNLAVNARDAMPDGGAIEIEVRNISSRGDVTNDVIPAGDYVSISVADTGTGMAPETVAKVFDPFFTTKEVGKGTGLGLSMVYGFVKQSGGHVSISSDEGVGTTVRLLLARKELHQQSDLPIERRAIGTAGATGTILVVEDDDDVRAYTAEILRELGYRVIEANDGPSAIGLLHERDFKVDLIVSDVVMPRMSGQELADEVHVTRPDVKVLFASGYTRDAMMREGRLRPGVDLITKPFTFEALAHKVADLLSQ